MILLSDNDLIVKLAQCNLIDEALEALGASRQACHVLNTLKYSLRLATPDAAIARYLGSSSAYDRIQHLLTACTELPDAPLDLDLLDHMEQIPQIDPGEQVLFQHAKAQHSLSSDYRLLTGDKRALKAICEYEHAAAFEFLRQRVVCLESSMLAMIDIYGFDYINAKIVTAHSEVPQSKFDGVLRAAFGSLRTIDHCRECLHSYSHDIVELLAQNKNL